MARTTRAFGALLIAATAFMLAGGVEPAGNLVAHYDFEPSDQEQTGVKDKAGPPFSHGTLRGRKGLPRFVEFRKGKALEFDSSDVQHVVVEAEDGLKGSFENGLTVSATIRFNKKAFEASRVFTIFSRYDFGTNNRSYSLAIRNDKGGKICVEWSISDDGRNVLSVYCPHDMEMGAVYDLVTVFDPAGAMEIYVDGKRRGTRNIEVKKLHNGPAPVMLGARSNKSMPANPFNGLIDDVRVWSKVMRPSETVTPKKQDDKK